jgi:hypothetical protein
MALTTPFRPAIKYILITKYIDSLGLKLPKMPQLPNFEPPPMPDTQALVEELYKLKEQSGKFDGSSLYTDEYNDALKKYGELVTAAREKYEPQILDIKKKIADARFSKNEYGSGKEELSSLISDKNKLEDEYHDALKAAKTDSGIDDIKQKFKKIEAKKKDKVSKDAEDSTEAKKAKMKSVMMEAQKIGLIKQYTDYVNKEVAKLRKFVDDTVQLFKDTTNMVKTAWQAVKDYFTTGEGDKWVADQCDKIDRVFDNFTEAFKELCVDMATLVAKIPNPDVIVTGAAAGIPNPGYKVTVFMEDFKKVMSDIMKIANYIKEIIAIATAMGFSIMELIAAFKKLVEAFEKQKGDADKQFKKAVKSLRKRQKWYLEHIKPKTEQGETKLAGYMYADLDVDYVNYEIKVKGYKCYCRRSYARTYMEDGELKKSYWIGGYEKNGGAYTDSSGKHYYYLKEDEIVQPSDYDDNELMLEMKLVAEESGDTDWGTEYDIDSGTDYDIDSGTTTLKLADGRTIVIDYLANVGDTIKLNDGTIITIT